MTPLKTSILWVSLAGLFYVGCQTVENDPILSVEGIWGAEHVELISDSTGIRIEYDCGHGQIDGPFVFDINGRFDLTGSHTREGGPVPSDPPDPVPAQYQGQITGDQMKLSVLLTETGDVLGPFILISGRQGRLFKCL